jgi:hypothetical protein
MDRARVEGASEMTTDPTPEAIAKAEECIGPHDRHAHGGDPEYPVEYCTACRALAEGMRDRIALALDAFAQAQAHPDCHPAALREHVERCSDHPMSRLKKRLTEIERATWEDAAASLDRAVAAAALLPIRTAGLDERIMQAVRISCAWVLTEIAKDFRARAAERGT